VRNAAEEHLRLDDATGAGETVHDLAGRAIASHRHHHALAAPGRVPGDVGRLPPAGREDGLEVSMRRAHGAGDPVEVAAGAATAAGRIHDEERSQGGLRRPLYRRGAAGSRRAASKAPPRAAKTRTSRAMGTPVGQSGSQPVQDAQAESASPERDSISALLE
jgi:hypothetical protein